MEAELSRLKTEIRKLLDLKEPRLSETAAERAKLRQRWQRLCNGYWKDCLKGRKRLLQHQSLRAHESAAVKYFHKRVDR